MKDLQQMDQQYIAPTYARFPVSFVQGKGSTLYDEAGKGYIDMGSGIAVSNLGHGNEKWVRAVGKQAQTLAHTSNLYYTEPQVKLAKLLCDRSGMKKVFFGNSGAEANECAIKVARKYSADKYGENQRAVILTLEGSFHGRTLATLSATGQDVFHHTFGPFPEGFRHVPPNDIAALEAALNAGDVCALLLEIVQGEGGVLPLSAEYLEAAAALTAQRDILFMVDEVQTGNGRTGKLFAYQHFGLAPDVVTTAKGLAGGLPMGACLLGEKTEQVLSFGTHATTFGGNPICAAAALAVQKQLTDELLTQVEEKGRYIRQELEGAPGVKSITGLGLMLGIETERDVKELVNALLENGVVTLTAKNKLRLLPPLTISEKKLKKAVSIIKEELGK